MKNREVAVKKIANGYIVRIEENGDVWKSAEEYYPTQLLALEAASKYIDSLIVEAATEGSNE